MIVTCGFHVLTGQFQHFEVLLSSSVSDLWKRTFYILKGAIKDVKECEVGQKKMLVPLYQFYMLLCKKYT